MKSKFFLSSGVFALFIFLASPMLLASDVSYSRPDPLMDYVSQETGFYDTVYWELDEGYCRNCHGSNLAEQHHMTDTAIHGFCTPCHWVGESGGLVISDCLTGNCHSWNDLDTNGSHHNTEDAATGNCIACHDETVIGEFGPGVSFEEDLPPPDMNLPTPFSCENCHWGQAVTGSGHPSTHDHIDEGLASYYEYGRGIHNTFETHHMASVGNIKFNCHMCHGFGFDPDTAVMNWDPCNPEIIRSCERCHTTDTLHNIHLPDLYGWEAVGFHVDDKPGNEPEIYRLFVSGEICSGCHASCITLAPVAIPNVLWPPNHNMVEVVIEVNADDIVMLNVEVTSNEPIDGLGDGDIAPDWTEPVIDEEAGIITLQLRAERSGNGDGREYTVAITAWDSTSCRTADAKIIVPARQRKNGE